MFTIEDIHSIKRNYICSFNDEIRLQIRAKDDPTVKKPEELTKEEKEKISAALFLSSIVEETLKDGVITEHEKEDFLKTLQKNFEQEALTGQGVGTMIAKKNPASKIWARIIQNLKGNKIDKRADSYLNFVMKENGKKFSNMRIINPNELEQTVKFDVENDFKSSLKPNNPIYTQAPKTPVLTQEQKAKRRAFVDELIANYDAMEHDEWYEQRRQDRKSVV